MLISIELKGTVSAVYLQYPLMLKAKFVFTITNECNK